MGLNALYNIKILSEKIFYYFKQNIAEHLIHFKFIKELKLTKLGLKLSVLSILDNLLYEIKETVQKNVEKIPFIHSFHKISNCLDCEKIQIIKTYPDNNYTSRSNHFTSNSKYKNELFFSDKFESSICECLGSLGKHFSYARVCKRSSILFIRARKINEYDKSFLTSKECLENGVFAPNYGRMHIKSIVFYDSSNQFRSMSAIFRRNGEWMLQNDAGIETISPLQWIESKTKQPTIVFFEKDEEAGEK